MIIVTGQLHIQPGKRDEFLTLSSDAVRKARQNPECREFSVCADSVDPNRVNVCEVWLSREAMLAFRGNGPHDGSFALIDKANIDEYAAADSQV